MNSFVLTHMIEARKDTTNEGGSNTVTIGPFVISQCSSITMQNPDDNDSDNGNNTASNGGAKAFGSIEEHNHARVGSGVWGKIQFLAIVLEFLSR